MIPPLTMASEQPSNGETGSNPAGNASPADAGNPLVVKLGGFQLHRASNCGSARTLQALEQGSAAKQWLQANGKEPFAMTAMRNALRVEGPPVPMNRLRDEDVIDQVAQLVKSGLWHVCEPVMRVYSVLKAEEPAVMAVPRRGSTASPPPAVSDAPETGSLPANADQAATAAALSQASELGIPFCEECVKNALRRAAAQATAA